MLFVIFFVSSFRFLKMNNTNTSDKSRVFTKLPTQPPKHLCHRKFKNKLREAIYD